MTQDLGNIGVRSAIDEDVRVKSWEQRICKQNIANIGLKLASEVGRARFRGNRFRFWSRWSGEIVAAAHSPTLARLKISVKVIRHKEKINSVENVAVGGGISRNGQWGRGGPPVYNKIRVVSFGHVGHRILGVIQRGKPVTNNGSGIFELVD